jgi:threonine synthase
VSARKQGIIGGNDIAVIDSTAHALKFVGFQEMYFEQRFPPEFNIKPNPELINTPVFVCPEDLKSIPTPDRPLCGEELNQFVNRTAEAIAGILGLRKKI